MRFGFPFPALLVCTIGCALPDPIRVMTFNIRYDNPEDGANAWSERKGLVLRTIRDFRPDVLGLQEVLVGQADEIRAELKGYEYIGVGRDDGQAGGEMVPVLFRKDRFVLVEGGHFWLSELPGLPGSVGWDAALPRMATWVRLQFRSNVANELHVINAHLDHRGQRARRESALLLRKTMESLSGRPIILMGDFNDGPSGDPYQILTSPTGNLAELYDSFVAASPQQRGIGTYHAFSGEPQSPRIDWILHSRRLESIEADIVTRRFGERFPSDHYPVTAVLRLIPATRHGWM